MVHNIILRIAFVKSKLVGLQGWPYMRFHNLFKYQVIWCHLNNILQNNIFDIDRHNFKNHEKGTVTLVKNDVIKTTRKVIKSN